MNILTLLCNIALAEPPNVEAVTGFRMGYGYVADSELQTPHLMVLGWDHMQTISTGTMIDVIVAGNVSLGGMNQGVLLPSSHLIVGYQFNDSLQLGIGPVLTFSELNTTPSARLNMIAAAGWNIKMGDVYFPIHAAYVPDVDGRWRTYITTGMNWPLSSR
jgi:hypothetical protein